MPVDLSIFGKQKTLIDQQQLQQAFELQKQQALQDAAYKAAVLNNQINQGQTLTLKDQIELGLQKQKLDQDAASNAFGAFGQPPVAVQPMSSPLSQRNNNPGNLRAADGSFQQFATPQAGNEAVRHDLMGKINGTSPVMTQRYGQGYTPTLTNLINTWAPPSENDTNNYVSFVSKKTGIDPLAPLSAQNVDAIQGAITQMEGGPQSRDYFGGGSQTLSTAQMQPSEGQNQAGSFIAKGGKIYNDGLPAGQAWYGNPSDKSSWVAKTIPGVQKNLDKPLPTSALKMQNEALDAVRTSNSINADLGTLGTQIDSGKLQFGPISNLVNRARNETNNSNDESRNYSTFVTNLNRLRNESLRLNKGVQTEGDAERAWQEIVSNLSDTKLVRQRLDDIQSYNKRAAELKKLEVDQIRANYSRDPFDFSQYENVPSTVNSAPKSQNGVKFLGFE